MMKNNHTGSKQNPVQARLAAVEEPAALNTHNKETSGSPTTAGATAGGTTNTTATTATTVVPVLHSHHHPSAALRSERKRKREKQRRTDVNQHFEELTEVLLRLEAEEQQRQHECTSVSSSTSMTPFRPSSRVELLARSIAQLEQLPRVIHHQQLEIVSLEQQVVVAEQAGDDIAGNMKQASAAVSQALKGSSTMAHHTARRVRSDRMHDKGSSSIVDGKDTTTTTRNMMMQQPSCKRGVRGGTMLAHMPSTVSFQKSRNPVMNNGRVRRKTHRFERMHMQYICIYL